MSSDEFTGVSFDWFVSKTETAFSLLTRRFLAGKALPEMLSPSGFASLSDLAVFTKTKSRRSSPSSPEVVFIGGHQLEKFLDLRPRDLRPRILLVGDGDRDWDSYPNLPSFVDRIYLQNLLVPATSRYQLLPIGVESLEWARNGLPWYFRKRLLSYPKKPAVLAGPFGKTHPERVRLIETLSSTDSPLIKFLYGRISTHKLSKLMASYQFTLCPRGNGVDTHRFWEALYRGSTPIILENQFSENLARIGMPFSTVKKFSRTEIESIVEADQTYSENHLHPNLNLKEWSAIVRS